VLRKGRDARRLAPQLLVDFDRLAFRAQL
jgi:hypothetical protein